jgi:hypothetical protein
MVFVLCCSGMDLGSSLLRNSFRVTIGIGRMLSKTRYSLNGDNHVLKH